MPQPPSLLGRAGPLIAARLVSACITLVIPLVLARMMPQAEYGTYKLLFLVSMTAAAVLPLGVAQSLYFFVPRAREPRVYFGQTLAFMLAAGATGGLALLAVAPLLARALSTPGLLEHRAELALFTALAVAAAPLETSITSQGKTRLAAIFYLTSDALRAGALVLPALGGAGLHGMMRAMVAWASLRLGVVWAVTLFAQRGRLWDRQLFRQQLAYALPFGVAIVFAIPQQYAHQFIVAHAVGPALFAVYAVACFELPFVDLFYTPTSEVLMVHLGELERAGRHEEGAAAFREAVGRLGLLLLPPIAFVFAVAPAFITTLFGPRFSQAAPLFRICLFVMPLGIWPLDATLRARGETQHILVTYLVKAAVSIPVVWLSVERFGLLGAAVSYVLSEVFGRALLAWRVPRALSAPGHPVRLRQLVPARALARTAVASLALAALGAGAYHVAARFEVAPAGSTLHRVFALGIASAVFGAGYLWRLLASGTQLPGALGALLERRRAKRAVTAA
ncbi:MAG TPA: lipopolysaccharide biosynthesis protein [Anaeromyxobacteraceae bacterium]